VGTRGEREPAGLHADIRQRAVVQRDQLSAGRHRQSRPYSGDHRDQPDARIDRRGEGHLAEFRRGVRAGSCGRGIRADEVGRQHLPR
jgi:hypothetical protein